MESTNPESSAGNERESTNQLFAGFNVGEKALYAGAQERKTVGVIVLLADNNEAGFRVAFEKIGQERAGGGFSGVSVNDVNLGVGRLKGTEVGRKCGFQLLGNNLEWGLR